MIVGVTGSQVNEWLVLQKMLCFESEEIEFVVIFVADGDGDIILRHKTSGIQDLFMCLSRDEQDVMQNVSLVPSAANVCPHFAFPPLPALTSCPCKAAIP